MAFLVIQVLIRESRIVYLSIDRFSPTTESNSKNVLVVTSPIALPTNPLIPTQPSFTILLPEFLEMNVKQND